MSKKSIGIFVSAVWAASLLVMPASANPTEQVLLNNLQKAQSQYGATDCRTGEMYFAVGKFYHEHHQSERAQHMFDNAMKSFDRSPGVNGDLQRYYSDALARVYMDQGSLAKAEPLFKKSISIAEKLSPKEKSCVLPNTLAAVAKLYEAQGRYDEAEKALKQRIELRKRFLSAGQIDIALVELANLYTNCAKFDQAKPLFDELLNISPMPVAVKEGYTTFLSRSAEKAQQAKSVNSSPPTGNSSPSI